ncbi:MAG TPA: hypothetical protein VGY91_11220 [Chthoniobacterales bacterium]|jgi:hypothetical protein|nr:hypothetical protein [Chthoniobacterales bacterium]
MNKRQFFQKALLASLPIAARMHSQMPEDSPAAWTEPARIAACAARIADELVTEWETYMVIADEQDADSANRLNPDYVDSRRHLDNRTEGGEAS